MDFGDFYHGTNVGGGSPKALWCRVMLWQHGITQCNDQGRPLWEEWGIGVFLSLYANTEFLFQKLHFLID